MASTHDDDAESFESQEDLAKDEFLRDSRNCAEMRKRLSKEELMDYLHMKSIAEVDVPTDAVQS